MRPRRDIRGAVVVITGASSGIGKATALAFAGLGARLVLAARDPEALGGVERACQAQGAQALAVPTDITDADAVERLARRAVDGFGRVDVWVQAAATMIAGPLGTEGVEELRRLVEVNVVGVTLSARAALATFQAQGQGTLVLVGSLLGIVPNPQVPLYSMTKYATRGLALNLRQAVAGQPGIHVCLVLPGPVDTPMFQRSANHTGRQLRAIPPAYAPGTGRRRDRRLRLPAPPPDHRRCRLLAAAGLPPGGATPGRLGGRPLERHHPDPAHPGSGHLRGPVRARADRGHPRRLAPGPAAPAPG